MMIELEMDFSYINKKIKNDKLSFFTFCEYNVMLKNEKI